MTLPTSVHNGIHVLQVKVVKLLLFWVDIKLLNFAVKFNLSRNPCAYPVVAIVIYYVTYLRNISSPSEAVPY